MFAWMLYAFVVGLLLALAARFFEGSAILRRKSARWVWVITLLASLGLPFAISAVSIQWPSLSAATAPATSTAVPLRQITNTALSPTLWIDVAGGHALNQAPQVDRGLKVFWGLGSAGFLLFLLAGGLKIRRERRSWQKTDVAGYPVLVADDIGPAVVGFFAPEIVVPRWLLAAPSTEQRMALAHERAHVEADDGRLLIIALCLVVCMPWNLPLWWQLRRLRRAIELDCDARVLHLGHEVGDYGEMLIRAGERHSRAIPAVAGMAESRSFLEERIRTMLRKKTRYSWASALGMTLLGCVLAAGAAEVSPPNTDPHHQVAIDAALLDHYIGTYHFVGDFMVTVTRQGDQLMAQGTGQAAFPIYPESDTRFFFKVVDAQIDFTTDGQAKAPSLVLHQNGAHIKMLRVDAAEIAQFKALAAERFASQTANPASEAALRRLMEGLIAGHPNYDEMSPTIAAIVREQMPTQLTPIAQNGSIRSIRFLGVGKDGADSYSVMQERGATHWAIGLDDKGIIVNARVVPGP